MSMELIPEECHKCGEMFDMTYEMNEIVEDDSWRVNGMPLCWNCRKHKLKVKNNINDGKEDDDFIINLEFIDDG